MARLFNKSQRNFIWSRDRGICGICGWKVRGDWQADHIWPYSLGGTTTVQNGQIAHPKCNNWKKAKVEYHWREGWIWETFYGYRSKKLEEYRNGYYDQYPDYDYKNW